MMAPPNGSRRHSLSSPGATTSMCAPMSSTGARPAEKTAHRGTVPSARTASKAEGLIPNALRMVGATWAVPTSAFTVLRSKSGSRTVKARDFFSGLFSTTIQPTEILSEIRIPAAKPQSGGAYLKLERKVGDFATVAVAVHLQMDDGKVRSAGIGLTAVGPQNLKAERAEAALRGARLDDATIKQAAALAAEAAEPKEDHRGSVEYKRNVVRVFTERGLKRAYERARGGG